MDKQLSFFESTNHDGHSSVKVAELSRRTDPSTSHEAAKRSRLANCNFCF